MPEITEFTIPATIHTEPRPHGNNQVFDFNLIGFSTVMLNDLLIDAAVTLGKRLGKTPQEILRNALDTAPVELT
jgi:hypothetical protein